MHHQDINDKSTVRVLAQGIGIRRVVFSLIIVLMLTVTACSHVANVPALQQTGGTWPRCISGCTANDVEINSVWLDVPPGNYTLGETVTHNVSMNLYFHRQNTYCIVVVADLYEGGVLQQADWASSIIGYHDDGGNYTYPMGTVNWTYGKLFEMRNVLVMWAPNAPKGPCPTNCTEYNAPSKCNQPPTFIVTTPLVVDFEFNEVCFCNDSTFTDKTTGGVKPYTWHWDFADGDSSTAQNATHHFDAAGTYTVTLNVTDSDSPPTTASQSYSVTVNQEPTANAGVDQSIPSCGGSVPVGGSPTGSGGTGPYTYNWTPTTGLDDPTSPNPTASAGGTYTVRVTDANGCWAEGSVVVTVSGAPTAEAGPDWEICAGGGPVQIGSSPTGGYTYNWTPTAGLDNPAIANPYASPASTTTYSVLVTSGNCQAADSVTVTVYDTPTCHISASPGATVCQGTTVTLMEDGGDAVGWSWSTGAHTRYIQVTSGGTYNVNITDTHGCQSSCQVLVMVHDGPTANAGVDKEICAGGSVQLNGWATGGNSPYTYDWTGPENHPNTQNPTVSTPGTYTLTVTDGHGCSDTDDVIVSQYSSPTANAGGDTGFCAGGSVQLSGSASGGTTPYTYGWTGPENHPNTQNPTVSTAGTYTLRVTDDKGCTDTDEVIVSRYSSPTADAGGDTGFCPGGSVQLSGSASGGTTPYTYGWTGPENHPNTQNATVSTVGTYTLTVTDGHGCSDTDDVIVSQHPSPTANAGADAVITAGGFVVIGGSPTASGGTPSYTYSWSPTNGLNDTSFANPQASPAVNTTYTVIVADSNGCTDSDEVKVTVIQDCCICGFVYRTGTTEALAGWQVILEKQTNPWVQVGSAITDANGKYCFCGLGSGYYRVREVVQPGWNQVSPLLPNEFLVTLPGGCCNPQSGPFLNFENEQAGPFTVGWEASPIDKLAVLAPWIALFTVIVAGASLLVLRRRRV